MNLIQIQEHLKDLPTQAIMSYANGQNPEVPPYMALGEMNRRKSMEQRAAQAPDSSIKDKLESELSQQTALPGIGQGMNMRMNPAGMPQPMQAAQPQMAPRMQPMQVPPMAQKMPPQQMSQPGAIPAGAPGMAGGGLANLPIRRRMFNYAPGGIVAFAGPDDQLVLPPGTPADPSESGTYSPGEGGDQLPVALANKILAQRLQGDMGIPEITKKDEIRKKIAEENPELGAILNKIPGEALGRLAAELETQNQSQRSKFQEGEGRQGLAALSQALISAGEATRGQKGMGGIGAAFGGFGKTYNAATQASEERAARQQATERAQTIETIKLQSDIENMKRAYAEGRVSDAQAYEQNVKARQEKIATMQGTAAKDTLTQYHNQLRDTEQSKHNRAMEEQARITAAAHAAQAKAALEARPSQEDRKMDRVMARVNGDPAIRALADQVKMADPNSDEYYNLVGKIQALAGPYYEKAGLEPPVPVKRTGPAPTPPKKGFFESLFGGSSTPPKPTAVPFDQLPQ